VPGRRHVIVLLAAPALALGGCGGEREAAPPAPKLPSALGEQLAAEADAVGQQLDGGDPCGAAERAAGLQQRAIAALNRPGQVPAELKEDLGVAAADLVDRAQTECAAAQPPPAPPPPAPPPPTTTAEEDESEDEAKDEKEDEDGRGNDGRGRGKGKGKKGK
jgi:hypothetical protein